MGEPKVYLNDGFVPASKAHLSIYDLGIVLGATLTEMTRTFGHQPFRLEDHLRRLYRSCKYAGIVLPLTAEEMLQKSRELIETNASLIGATEELGVVHFVTPGENRSYAGSAAGGARLTPMVCIHSFPLPFHVWKHLFTEGAHVVTPAIRHVPAGRGGAAHPPGAARLARGVARDRGQLIRVKAWRGATSSRGSARASRWRF